MDLLEVNMIKFLILANNGSLYYHDPRWPKYNVAYLSVTCYFWFECELTRLFAMEKTMNKQVICCNVIYC